MAKWTKTNLYLSTCFYTSPIPTNIAAQHSVLFFWWLTAKGNQLIGCKYVIITHTIEIKLRYCKAGNYISLHCIKSLLEQIRIYRKFIMYILV